MSSWSVFNLILCFQIYVASRVFKLEFCSTSQMKDFLKLFKMVIDFMYFLKSHTNLK